MTIKLQKTTLRKEMMAKRNKIDRDFKKDYDNWVCSELEKVIVKGNYQSVHAYIPIFSEIDITPLLRKLLELQITVICPKTLPKRKLENRELISLEDLETGIMGTLHPKTAQSNAIPEVVIVPGLAFDVSNFRLGYGGGYYDTFLTGVAGSHKIGIFYPFQKVNAVPLEPHDIRLDTILVKD